MDLIILILSAYGFYTAIQMLRGNFLNFKPFNCNVCLAFWFTFCYIVVFDLIIVKLVIYPFAVSGGVYLLKLIEDRLTHYEA